MSFRLRIYALILFLLLPFSALAAEEVGEGVLYYQAGADETLSEIAQKYDLGIGELRAANRQVPGNAVREGMVLVVPQLHLLPDVPHEGIVINLAERRLYYFPSPDAAAQSFPVTIGKEGWETPTGKTYVAQKRADPVWIPPDDIRAENPELPAMVGPGPDNPLGKYALDLGWDGYRIHGTNNPSSIGRQSSHGCIRMYPADIETLFNQVDVKTKVTVINAPYKLAWRGSTLFLEVTPPAQGATGRAVAAGDIHRAVAELGGADIDWDTVRYAMKKRDGVPIAISSR